MFGQFSQMNCMTASVTPATFTIDNVSIDFPARFNNFKMLRWVRNLQPSNRMFLHKLIASSSFKISNKFRSEIPVSVERLKFDFHTNGDRMHLWNCFETVDNESTNRTPCVFTTFSNALHTSSSLNSPMFVVGFAL
jgi:hypothetical protein